MESEPDASTAEDTTATAQELPAAEPSNTQSDEGSTVAEFEVLEDGTVGGHELPGFFD